MVDALVSYTHYFEKGKFDYNTSPIQNEFYASMNVKESWFKPGIALGYSIGQSYDIVAIDTTVKVLNQRVHIVYTDTASIKITSYSAVAGFEHSFFFRPIRI